VEEMPYFRLDWAQVKKLVYGDQLNSLLSSLRVWKGEEIDAVYSITYPYDLTPLMQNGRRVPTCVYYTSEFGWVDQSYFALERKSFASDADVAHHIAANPQIYFTSPSVWSSWGLSK
jgi:hypothetical protein